MFSSPVCIKGFQNEATFLSLSLEGILSCLSSSRLRTVVVVKDDDHNHAHKSTDLKLRLPLQRAEWSSHTLCIQMQRVNYNDVIYAFA